MSDKKLTHNCCMNLTEVRIGINGSVKREFFMDINYCHDHQVPYAASFVKFFKGRRKKCNHSFSSFTKIRFYIKQLPPQYKPFSMNVMCCPHCDVPVEVQFITYEGDISRYPKVKDMGKLKKKDIPEANVSEYLSIAS